MNLLRSGLNGRQPAYGMIATLKDPAVIEMAGYAGYDFAVIDMEHTTLDFGTAEHMLRAAEGAGIHSIIRTPKNDYDAMLRVLDAGAEGIMVPHLTSREQAQRTVDTAKYRPFGKRGLDGSSRAARYGAVPFQEHLKRQNNRVTVIGMIEDTEAVDRIRDIVAVDGLDALFIGPADLAASLGHQDRFDHPEVIEAMKETVRISREAGVGIGIPAFTADDVARYADWGCTFFTIPPIDVLFFTQALSSHLAGIRQHDFVVK
ncbi:HpcH/HpaI aldolase family protein [Cohnella algarum]|uniref:HpcH/HpaI aldolase family protein n=1 Tax=Cohnella algarum TaxID=2044859 RepID=UPI001967ABBC|nr:aldolase/citrate lyase family protein [Cohnella algarum]MBN2984422.1 siderophore biosynthesis protein SbnG [Cohnella algarum]